MWYQLIFYCLLVVHAQGFSPPGFAGFFTGNDQQRAWKVTSWYIEDLHSADSSYAVDALRTLGAAAGDKKDVAVQLACRFYMAYYHVTSLHADEPWITQMRNLITEAEERGFPGVAADYTHMLGMIYCTLKKEYIKGLSLLNKAHQAHSRTGYANHPHANLLLYEFALVCYKLRDFEASIRLLTPAVYSADTTDVYLRLQVMYVLGLAYRNIRHPDSTLSYFTRILNLARDNRIVSWTGIASEQIGRHYIQQAQYARALPYMHSRHQFSMPHDERLPLHELAVPETEQSKEEPLAHAGNTRTGWLYPWKNDGRGKGSYYKPVYDQDLSVKDYEEAHRSSVLEADNDSYAGINGFQMVQSGVGGMEQHDDRIIARENDRIVIQRRAFILILLSLFLLLLLNIYTQRRMLLRKDLVIVEVQQELKRLHAQKRTAEEQLSECRRVLEEQGRTLEACQAELERMSHPAAARETEEHIMILEQLHKTAIITEEGWISFREQFEKVYSGFFVRMKEKFPEVTPAEMRLMALVKLNITTREMADLLGISPESIRKTGYRFLKKINRTGETSLDELVSSI
jgi:tetratricopeptide (TPR) repeat protein